MRIGKHQQDALSAKVLKRAFRSIQAWQSKIRSRCAGFETIAVDPAALEATVGFALVDFRVPRSGCFLSIRVACRRLGSIDQCQEGVGPNGQLAGDGPLLIKQIA